MIGYRWSNPNHCVNSGERMRHRGLHTVAGKHRNYEGFWKIAQLSFEPIEEGAWQEVAGARTE